MNGWIPLHSRLGSRLRAGVVRVALISLVAALITGCLDRPVSPASPNTTNVFVQDIRQTNIDKIDLLFMIDNSMSMADKQLILADAVPQLLNRLITPKVVDGEKEFEPVLDIHIGIVSSSLGGHGGDQCSDGANPTQNDNAHLIGSVRSGLESYSNLGFLWWDASDPQKGNPPGESDAAKLGANFTAHVTTTGEQGCGYEASLESWYRFLVDPAPPAKVVLNGTTAEVQGVDDVVLQQRKDFLRPNSLVAIILLSDENDCSVIDGGYNWIATQTSQPNGTGFHLGRATAACAKDPDDPCCRSCLADEKNGPPAGCGELASDAECKQGDWDDVGDHPNLRCFEQKRRFGLEFLYPTRRYVEALSQPRICPAWDANGPVGCQFADPAAGGYRVCNPLFLEDLDDPTSCEAGTRDPALVYVAGIVGVPWQDIATQETLNDPTQLRYLTASEIGAEGRWDWLVPRCKTTADQTPGNPGNQLPRPIPVCDRWDPNDAPDDALMIESSSPRTGKNPALDVPLSDPSGPELGMPGSNPINGHEWLTDSADLEYACIFKRSSPKDCSTAGNTGCDCDDPALGTASYTQNNPLCQGGGTYSKQQAYAKAFPGTRQLQVLKDFGKNSIVASICPKVTSGAKDDASYGYNPAVEAIIERLKDVLQGQCVNRPIAFPPGPDGKPDPSAIPQCAVVEVLPNDGSCVCDSSRNRSDVSPALVGPVFERLKETGQCTGAGCKAGNFCMCEIGFVKDRGTCENQGKTGDNFGWCYVDPSQGIGNPELVKKCNPQRQLIFSGDDTPAAGSTAVIACLGAPIASAAP